MTYETIIVTTEGVTLAKIIWQFLKRQPEGYLELVLEHNPGVSALGPVLPIGTAVKLPIEEIPQQTSTRTIIRLWD